MRRLLPIALLLVGCGEPPAPEPTPTAPDAPVAPAPPETPTERPKAPPLPGPMPEAPSPTSSPANVLRLYVLALREGDAAAAAAYAHLPDDDAGRARVESRLDEEAGRISSGTLRVDVLETRVAGASALAVVKITDTRPVRIREAIEPRFLRRVGEDWRVVVEATLTGDEADGELLAWFTGAKGDFEREHLKER